MPNGEFEMAKTVVWMDSLGAVLSTLLAILLLIVGLFPAAGTPEEADLPMFAVAVGLFCWALSFLFTVALVAMRNHWRGCWWLQVLPLAVLFGELL